MASPSVLEGTPRTNPQNPREKGAECVVKEHIQTCIYQAQLLHKEFQQPLNVVSIAKTNLRTKARIHHS
jgi:hypothetical protein